VRQVDLDELTYQIFSGLRSWTPSVRARVFAPAHKQRPFTRSCATDTICRKLSLWDFIDPADPGHPLSLKQVSAIFEAAVDTFPGAIARLWLSGHHDREREAHSAAAILLAKSLQSLEILSPTSLDQHGTRMVWFTMPVAPDYAFGPSWP
jgi:hypothetical protein